MKEPLPSQNDDNTDSVQCLIKPDRYKSLRMRTCKTCKYSTTNSQQFLHHQVTEHGETDAEPSVRGQPETLVVTHKQNRPRHSSAISTPVKRHMDNATDMVNEANNNEKILGHDKEPSRVLPPGEYKASHQNDQSSSSSPEDADDAIEVFECGLCSFATTKLSDLKSHQAKHGIGQPKLFENMYGNYGNTGRHRSQNTATSSEYEIMQRSYLSAQNGIRNNEMKNDDVDDSRLIIDESVPKTILVTSHLSHIAKPKPVYMTPGVPHRAKPGPKPGTTGSAVRPRTGCAPVREAVDPAKYITIQEPDGIKYACSKCGNIYKWRKSLNKHWKEKHDGEIPDPRPNLTALNIPRLGKGYVTGLANGKGNVISFLGTQQSQQRNVRTFPAKMHEATSLMSGGNMSLNSSEIRKVLKRPAMADLSGSPKAVEVPPGNGSSKTNSVMHYVPAASLQDGMNLIRVNKMPRVSSGGSLTRYAPSTTTSYAKYRSATITDKLELVSSRQNVRESTPVDLSRQESGYSGMQSSQSSHAEDILDLSKKSPGSLRPVARMMDIDLNKLPRQDEPLDFSMKTNVEKVDQKSEREHMDLVADEVKSLDLRCPSCSYCAESLQDYDVHMELHLRKQHYRCAVCQDVFVTMETLNDHFLHTHHETVQQKLSKDGISKETKIPESTQLYKYLTMDSQKQPLSCAICGMIFQWQWTLAKHFDQCHQPLPNPYKKKLCSTPTSSCATSVSPSHDCDEAQTEVKSDPESQLLQCSQCLFTTSSSVELARHQLKHPENQQYMCYICSYETRWKDELVDHYKEEHPTFSVDISQVTNSDRDVTAAEAKQYIELSDNDTAIVFPQAPEDTEFYSNTERENKRRKADDSPAGSLSTELLLPFKCTVCEYRARWPSEITQHMKNHSDQKPYLCPRCSYRSKWKWDVVKHLKRCGGGTVNDVIDTTKTRRSHGIQSVIGETSQSQELSLTQQRELLSNGPPNVTVLPNVLPDGCSSGGDPGESTFSGESLGKSPLSESSATARDEVVSVSPRSESGSQSYHVCLHCPFVGNSPAELKRHCRVHSDEKPFICKTCGYCSKWKCDLKKHLRTYKHTSAVPLNYGGHGRKPADYNELKNVEGDENTDQESNDDEDDFGTQKTEEPTLYKCDKCQYVTYKKNFLESHSRIHRDTSIQNSAAKLRCKQCAFQASDLPSFLKHKLSHTQGSDTLQTPPAEYSSTEASPTTRHRRKAAKQNHITCMSAEFSDPIPEDEKNGKVAVSSKEQDDTSTSLAVFDFSQKAIPDGVQDPKLNKSFPSGSSAYECKLCLYATDDKDNYEAHMKYHNTNNKYVCEWCSWSIDSLNHLYRHAQMVHPNELAHQEKETFYVKRQQRKSSEDNAKDEDEINGKSDTEDVNDEEMLSQQVLWCKRQDMSNIEKRRLEARWEGTGAEEELMLGLRSKRRRRLKTCAKCGYITDNVTTLQRHMAKHGSKGKFTCQFCDYSVDRQHIIDYHIKIVHQAGVKPDHFDIDCHEEDSTSEGHDDSAEMYDSELMPDEEDQVEKMEEDVNEEVVWEITRVKGQEMKVQRIGRKTTYHCLKCPFFTCNITNAVNHIKQHGLRKRYTCEMCDYSLDQLRHVIHHMKKVHGHSTDLSFSDNNDDGDRSVSDANLVKQSIKGSEVTTRADKKKNPKSSKTFICGRKKSQAVVQGRRRFQRRYPCSRCQFVAHGMAAITKHMKKHKRFGSIMQCTICHYTATTSQLLEKHVQCHQAKNS